MIWSGATFGRGFYILDDYAPLREVSEAQLKQEASLFAIRKAWWYIPRPVLGFGQKGSQGEAYYTAPNPPFGAVFTYYLKDGLQKQDEVRKKAEKKSRKQKQAVRFPGCETVEQEARQQVPRIWLTVRDSDGNVVRRLEGPRKKGIHRVAWNLRFPPVQAMQILDKYPENEPLGAIGRTGTIYGGACQRSGWGIDCACRSSNLPGRTYAQGGSGRC